jgi:superfamily II DNA or RNA helicase
MVELNQSLLAELGGWPAMKEARALVERGKVLEVSRDGATIRARVQGTEKIHEPQITLADRVANVAVRCTCPDSRRSGRVCAHALAAGLALLQPPKAPVSHLGDPGNLLPGSRSASAATGSATTAKKRYLLEEAPLGTPRLEFTVLLPLQLADALAKDPVRVILEARRDGDAQAQPLDAILPAVRSGFAVGDEDERLLGAMERTVGSFTGVNAIARGKIGLILRALDAHPRVWLGKKQRIDVRASAERPQLLLRTGEDGSLVVGTRVPSGPTSVRDGKGLPSLPSWNFDGATLTEFAPLPAGFSPSGTLVVPRDEIPDFLSRRLPELERTCDLAFAPGFEEFQLEVGRPAFEAKLDGALSGLTLELVAHYGDKAFVLDGKAEASSRYHPDAHRQNRFWRRDTAAERAALDEIERAGFALVRGDKFSLIRERDVARFLANALPRWRQRWAVHLGSRLESVMVTVDIAEPEFSLRRGSGEDWLSLDLKLTMQGEPVPLDAAEIQRWLQTGQTHARTANNRTLLVPTEAWSEMQEVLADCEVAQQPGAIRVARTFAPYVANALTAQGFRAGENITADAPPPDVQATLDPKLWAQLRPYQAHGISWLAGLAQQKLNGLLADDMGLGKTLQALAFAAWLRAQSSREPVLVVCPTSLVTNWLRETARFTPHLRALDLTGADRAAKFATRGDHDLLVTSYAILRRDVEMYRAAEFSLVILDEAQHIKNRGSQNAQAAKALRADRRLVLTGTPLENSVLDLWSIFDFLLPGYLGTPTDFCERYETPLTKSPDARVMARLRQRVKPFFLRRTKEEVLTELPPKLEFPTLCELTDEQKEVYRAVLEQGRRDVFEHAGKAGQGRDRLAVLTTLLRLRQVCCHLDLLPSGETKRMWQEPSAKMERTFELIDEAIDGGHRVLLFSQFVRALHLLREEARRREIAFCYLDGQTVERQAEIDRFQNDAAIPLFFISLKAGGTGLNLTGADVVIHFDPWWNPAVEEQATARAHRLGQARSVSAYKLIAAGTVEEKIQALQARKRELFEASLSGDDAFVGKLSNEDVEELLA